MKDRFVFATLVLAMVATTKPSRADSVAASLFADGKKLFADGHAVAACEKFDLSNRLEPGIGIRFHLARCHERIGRTASAWAGYLEVAAAAHEQGQGAREKLARSSAAALEPHVTRLVLEVHGERTEGLTITRNGALLSRNQWATPTPVDPGPETIEAAAPGKKPWRMVTEVTADKRERTVIVPDLEASESARTSERRPSPGALPELPEPARTGPARIAGVAIGVAGALGIGAGGFFALMALSQDSRARPHCHGDACDRDGVSLRGDALASGSMSTLAFAVGGGLLASGVALYLLSPSRDVPVAASRRVEMRAGLGRLEMRARW